MGAGLRMAALAALLLVGAAPAAADDAAQAEIRAALAQWTADFNARNAGAVCDIFEPDVVADIRTEPEQRTRAADRLLLGAWGAAPEVHANNEGCAVCPRPPPRGRTTDQPQGSSASPPRLEVAGSKSSAALIEARRKQR